MNHKVDLTELRANRRSAIAFGKSFATHFQIPLSSDHSTRMAVAEVKDHGGSKWQTAVVPVPARYIRIRALKPDGDHQKGGQMSVAIGR